MYAQLTLEELLEQSEEVKNFVIAKSFENKELIDLASNLKDKKSQIVEIYWLDGSDSLNYPSFDSIRLNPRFIVQDKQIRKESDGLIFPQSNPIILVIANFNFLTPEDKKKYLEGICKKEEHDYNPHIYLHEESIVIIGIPESADEPKISYKLEVRSLK